MLEFVTSTCFTTRRWPVVLVVVATVAFSCGTTTGQTTAGEPQSSEVATSSPAPPSSVPDRSFDRKTFRPPAPAGWHYSHTFTHDEMILVSYESDIQDQKDLTGRATGRTLNINLIDAQNTEFARTDRQGLLDEYLASPTIPSTSRRTQSPPSISGLPAASWIDSSGPQLTSVVVVAVNPTQLIQVVSSDETGETLSSVVAQVIGR